MANEGYHEPVEELSDETRDMHRAIISLMEELEAVDWYNQRVDACKDPELKAIPIGESELLRDGDDVLILAYGTLVHPALEAAAELPAPGRSPAEEVQLHEELARMRAATTKLRERLGDDQPGNEPEKR